jgi:hypothetical protein
MVASMDEMGYLVVDSHLSSVIFTNNPTKTSYSRLCFICVPPRIKGRLKRPQNYNVMRRMRRVADHDKAKEKEKSDALESYSSIMASILAPHFVKEKVKRNKRRNECHFQREKHRQEKEPHWESELEFHPSQPITFEPFIEGCLTFYTRKVYHQLCAFNKLSFPSRKRKKKKQFQFNCDTHNSKSKPPGSRQRALIAAARITVQYVSSTVSVYAARNHPEFPIVIDSGASVSVTPHIRDFRGLLQKCPTTSLDGLSSKTEVLGMVKVKW